MPNPATIHQHHEEIDTLRAAQKLADYSYDRQTMVRIGGDDRVMSNIQIAAEIERHEAAIRDAGQSS